MKPTFSCLINLVRSCLVVSSLVLMCVHSSAQADDQMAISQNDLNVIKQYLVQIRGQIADIQATQSKMEQEVEAVRIRIRKAGKGS